ncbi:MULTISPECIES: SurA N-terminal domain-containing protein [Protofrankia]|nr:MULTISPECIES: SurA N-terminal domain-containing protein [Protofrankia]
MKPRSAARRILAGVALVVLSVSACTTHAGSAAQIGDDTIKTSTLRDVVDRGLAVSRSAAAANPSAAQSIAPIERTDLQRRALTTLVQLDLLEREARSLGITVADQDRDAFYQTYGVLEFGGVADFEQLAELGGIARQDLRLFLRSNALESAIADRLAPAPDTDAAKEQARGRYDKIVTDFRAKGKQISLSFDQAQGYLIRSLAADQRNQAVYTKLRETASREPVSINPRFGTWDSAQLAVAAAGVSIATTPAPEPPLGPGLATAQ